jgi:hypothetical protein
MSNETTLLFYHRLIESLKHAYGHRLKFGDPVFNNVTQVFPETKITCF